MGYYLSCMIVFNIIFLLRYIFSGESGKIIELNYCKWHAYVDISAIILTGLMILLGLICTVVIVSRNDNNDRKGSNEKGCIYRIESYEDITTENYLGKYSLLVLSAISLPVGANVLSLAIYIIFVITIGIIYIKREMIYMNPILTLLNYNIFKCQCKRKLDVAKVDGSFPEKVENIIIIIKLQKGNREDLNRIFEKEKSICTKNIIDKTYFYKL